MKTKSDRLPFWKKEPLAFEFKRCKGDKVFNGEVESIKKKTLLFRAGNGKIMKIGIVEKLKFPLPKNKRIDIVVNGNVGHYILASQMRKVPIVEVMINGG